MASRFLFLILAFAAASFAQLAPPNSMGVSMGHYHLNSPDPQVQAKFWTAVGAQHVKLGPLDVYKVPGALIFISKAEPSGGTVGSVVNHIGLKVRDLKGTADQAVAAGAKIASQNDLQIMLDAPDGLRLELTLDPAQTEAVMNHHIHFNVTDIEATRKWYASTFGAIPGKRGRFEAADVPGVNLSFTKVDAALAGTKGRTLDHIGFEVKDLEGFTKKLQDSGVKFDVPYRKVPALGIAIAFFTDPWGTYIELTEGLGQAR